MRIGRKIITTFIIPVELIAKKVQIVRVEKFKINRFSFFPIEFNTVKLEPLNATALSRRASGRIRRR